MAKKYTLVALFLVFVASPFAALATSCGCGCTQNPPQGCEQTENYSESFTTTSFTEDHHKYYFNFDAIQEPGDNFEITSATLTVTTNSNGHSDSIWIKSSSGWWEELGHLNDTDVQDTQTFTLGSSYFDEILSGVYFKAWFSLSSEWISFAELTVNGKYCPPPSAVPVPGAVWLFGSALAGLIGFGRRRRVQH